jgi:hypothetical protein
MVKELITAASWLQRFEDDWCAEWFLVKGVNMRCTEYNRSRNQEKERNRQLARVAALSEDPIEMGKFPHVN